MIIGIGVDLIEIDRVEKAYQKAAFQKKYFTQREIEFIGMDYKKAAGNFAVKEAVAKMFGTGFRGFAPIDVEVLRDEQGKPYVNLIARAQELAKAREIKRVHVSISNVKEYANAFVIGEA
ncbi:MAG: holo-ACP synthase [Mobilitalea sp.]